MNIKTSANFVPGNIAAILQTVTAANFRATTKASEIVRDLSKERASFRTGAMQSGIYSVVTLKGLNVTGAVVSPEPYSIYQEMGVGERGANSAWAGPYEYSTHLRGFPAVGFMRSSLDDSEQDILNCYKSEGFK